MEGLTDFTYRNAYEKTFGKGRITKYFTPFIPAAKKMSKKIKRDLAAENNGRIRLVPQLIGNRADEFLMMIRQLEELGFTSVNLNFGSTLRCLCKVSAGRTDYSSAPADRLLQRNTADGNSCPCSGADPCAALLQWRYMQCGRL